MRLIDADALNIRDVSPSYWSHVLGVEKEDIDDAPTVDAIPISFINQLVELSRKVGADHHAESLEILLKDWAERKEE